ncbi:MAG: bifunctional oligoribonuclease/PAP phosphatase NrnA [Nitrospiraceae bacterium]|nr:bifunctional oligoribonuclease/PAP phosphatase NrnA [Nitrospiraceae bacterium]
MSNPPDELISFLRAEDDFLIAVHFDPDGDCIGSASALAEALKGIGKKVTLFCETRIPESYFFMSGAKDFRTIDDLVSSGLSCSNFSAMVIVDANSIKRIAGEKNRAFFDCYEGPVAVIDHHETESQFGSIRWVEPYEPATGMMVHELLKKMNVALTKSMASNLYTAIVVDTGNFRFDNVTPQTFLAASELASAGAVPADIYRELYESWSTNRLALFRAVLSTLTLENGVAFMHATKKMFADTGADSSDAENFVSFPRTARDVRASVFIREVAENHYKLSLRSKGDLNVARIAEKFGGGGHKNAAGCVIKESLENIKTAIMDELKVLPDSR